MKTYKILKFKDTNENIEYVLNEGNGLHEGLHKNLHQNVLIGTDRYEITSIKDNTRDLIFSIGEKINEKEIIDSIHYGESIGEHSNHYTIFLNDIDIKQCIKQMAKTKIKTPVKKVAILEEEYPFQELEEKILKEFKGRTLKFGGDFVRKRAEKKLEFMQNFFQRNKEFNTIWSDTKVEQTSVGRRRSLGDIFMICRYYYPKCTLASIINYLYGENKLELRTQFCDATKKRVFRKEENENTNRHPQTKDEYGNIPSYYDKLINQANENS